MHYIDKNEITIMTRVNKHQRGEVKRITKELKTAEIQSQFLKRTKLNKKIAVEERSRKVKKKS